jgi:hypothetical protein
MIDVVVPETEVDEEAAGMITRANFPREAPQKMNGSGGKKERPEERQGDAGEDTDAIESSLVDETRSR